MGPFIQSKESVRKIMIHVMIALLPIIIFAIYKNGYIPYIQGYGSVISILYPLLFILVGSFTSFAIEAIYYLYKKQQRKIFSSYSFLPGLFLSLLLPMNTPIYILIIGCVVATIIGKLVFGGFGKNLVNPALVGYVVVMIVFSSMLGSSSNAYELDIKLIDALLYLVAFIYLTVTKTIKWKIPVFYIGTVFVLTMMVGRILGQGLYYPIIHILSGSLMFGAIFMATDPVTSCVTPIGQIFQGIILGILTVIIQFVAVEGVAISILIVNLFVPFLDQMGAKSRFDLSKTIVPFAVIAILMMGTAIGIAALNRSKQNDSNLMAIQEMNFDIQNLVEMINI